jgi:hypothetical protein
VETPAAPKAVLPPARHHARKKTAPASEQERPDVLRRRQAWFDGRLDLDQVAGAALRFLPPCSPDFNPIENAFAKLKALLRRAAERTVEDLRAAIGRIVDAFTPGECANCFSACGYDGPGWQDSAPRLT